MNTTYFSDNFQSGYPWDFPGGPVVKTPHFQCERCGFDSWSEPSLVAQLVKNLPAVCETRVQSLGREDPLEKEMATHSNILAWRIPWTKEPGGLQSMRLQRVGHVWATNIFTRNYGPTCHRLDRKKKKKTTKWLFLICDWVSSGARAPPSTFCPLNACLPESLFQAGRGRKTTKGLCVKDLEVGWEMAHTTLMYKEAGKSSLAAHPRRRGNGLNGTTFTVNYFGCQVQAENVNLRLCLNCNWHTLKKIFNLSEPQVFFSLEQWW